MSKKIAVAGYSGHAYAVIDTLMELGFKIVGYLDKSKASKNPFHLDYLGSETDSKRIEQLKAESIGIALGIGDNNIRHKVASLLLLSNLEIVSVIHPQAIVSKYSKVGKGCFIAPGAVVNTFSIVGDGAIINTSAIVEHECMVGEYCHIAPGAILTGNVSIGSDSFVGANAVVKQGITVGNYATLGAGATLIHNMPSNETWAGVPAKKII